MNEELLSQSQLETLRAAMNRLIPPDDYPGAWEAGCGDYLLRQLAGDLQPFLSMYRHGLTSLDAEAVAWHGMAFAALNAEGQDDVLHRVENGQTQAEWPVGPRDFFSLLLHHTAEGYYADPGNGGNRDRLSWKMIGFERSSSA